MLVECRAAVAEAQTDNRLCEQHHSGHFRRHDR